jgi:23S rRNA pseudouridine1911/1915/1917 synthase
MILLDRLTKQFPTAKRQTLKRMLQNRRVFINGIPAARLSQLVKPQDVVVVEPAKVAAAMPSLPFPIVFEDRDVLVVDKPAGLLTSTVPREPRPTVLAAVRNYLADSDPAARAGLVHRLDREASGLLVFSKNPRAYESLKRQFFHHTVKRLYHAVVSPPPRSDSARIESFLVEHADGTVHSTRLAGKGKLAITEFSVAKRRGKIALLFVTLHTGRKHQIRAHLSELGSPILGDGQYGAKAHEGGLLLAAVELAFDHPRAGKRISFKKDSVHWSEQLFSNRMTPSENP